MQQVIINGITHQVVTPSQAMHRSSMIRDVIESGGMFVVNQETGALDIYRPRMCYYMEDKAGNLYKLEEDYNTLMAQIRNAWETRDTVAAAYRITSFVIRKQFNSKDLFRTTILKDNFNEFMRQVSYAYKNI